MSTIRPVVQVYQEFATVTTTVLTPDLNCIVIGPCYHILDYATDKSQIYLQDVGANGATANTSLRTSAINSAVVPNNKPGAVVIEGVVFLDSGYAEIMTGTVATPAAAGVYTINSNILTDTDAGSDFVASGVLPGDRIVISQGATNIIKTVLSVTNPTTLKCTTNFTADNLVTTTINYRVERSFNNAVAKAAGTILTINNDSTVTIAASLKVDLSATVTNLYVNYAKLYVQYRALRQIGTAVDTVESTTDLTTKLGKIDERNPLAVAAFVAFQNSNKPVQYLGVNTNDLTGFTTAKDVINGNKEIYCIVPVTSDISIIQMFKAHVDAASDPTVSNFRIVIGSSSGLPVTSQISPTHGNSSGNIPLGDLVRLRDNTASFQTYGVAAGDILHLSTDGGVTFPTTKIVNTVDSENELTVTVAGTSGAYTYYIDRTLNRTQQVSTLQSVTTSLKDSRVTMVWPDKCWVAGVTNAYTQTASVQPGYYLAAAVGGMVAGLPPHQGFTFLGLSGVTSVVNSNDYFYDDQIDSLASAGWYIIVQDTPSAIPYCLRELTTDPTTLESGELMVVKNFDYVSLTYKNALVGFLGRYNVIPETLGFLKSSFDGVTSTLLLQKYPRIGSPILSGSVTQIAVDPGSADRVNIYGSVTLPKPLNQIGLYLTA